MSEQTNQIETVTISVTQEHIEAGEARNCSRCPLALAVAAAGIERPEVDYTFVDAFRSGQRVRAALPAVAIVFVTNFDHGHPVRPFTFDLSFDRSYKS